MSNKFLTISEQLKNSPKIWLVTGCAGFIGSNLLEYLLFLNQKVIGLDNFSTGYKHNLTEVKSRLNDQQWAGFKFIEGDIRDIKICKNAVAGADYVLHQAALGSVPRSINDPATTNEVNISGQLNILLAARDAGVKSVVYAASSSTYGDHPGLPKVEDKIGKPLSPYAITKYVNELYAEIFTTTYGLNSVGLRYFNVFGQRQDPDGAYAAVIPKWIASMIKNDSLIINGDGETSRDFCFIENVIQANVLAATAGENGLNQVYNVAFNDRTTLNQLFSYLKEILADHNINYVQQPIFGDFRPGDVRHSQADISKAAKLLSYKPEFNILAGLKKAMPWYIQHLKQY